MSLKHLFLASGMALICVLTLFSGVERPIPPPEPIIAISVVKKPIQEIAQNNTITCRVTAANLRSRVNYQGKSLHKLMDKYKNICAVSKSIPLWSYVYIEKTGKTYLAVDTMYHESVRKHKARYKVDACIDIYHDIPTKQLHKKDMGVTKAEVKK